MDKRTVLHELLTVDGVYERIQGIPKLINILDILSKNSYNLKVELGVSAQTTSKYSSIVCPDKPKTGAKLDTWILRKYGYKQCSNCLEVLNELEFHSNSSKLDGLNCHCKSCCLETRRDYQRFYQATRAADKLKRTPSWADLEKIKVIYDNCPEGYHVDHEIPLKGVLVSGLHVENNLQYLLAIDNITKNNKFQL